LWPVLLGEVAEVCETGTTACDQHLRHAIERVADLAEELMLGSYRAAMLAGDIQTGMHRVFLQLACAELQHLRRLVIDQDHGVKKTHGMTPGWKGWAMRKLVPTGARHLCEAVRPGAGCPAMADFNC
jgi:hypothetical protein